MSFYSIQWKISIIILENKYIIYNRKLNKNDLIVFEIYVIIYIYIKWMRILNDMIWNNIIKK